MSNYADSSPVSKDGGKGGRKSDRNVSPKGTIKNNDGRIMGGAYDVQCDNEEGGLPNRKASLKSKQTFDPNEDAPRLQGGTILNPKRREGLEEGAY